MRILVAYRGIPGRAGWETGASLVRAFRYLGHDAQPYAKTYQQAEWRIPAWSVRSADLLLHLECNDSDPQYGELAELRCPRVYWEFDTAMHVAQTRDWLAAQKFSLVFMANRRAAAEFGVEYLPYGFDDELMKSATAERSGAAIIGTDFPARREFASALAIPLRQAFNEEYVRLLSSLLVHVHHYDSGGAGLIVGRPWETMGLGTCLLTQRTPELAELFTDGVHCVMYDAAPDAAAKLGALLTHPEEAMGVGGRGRTEVQIKHTYVHRAAKILRLLGISS